MAMSKAALTLLRSYLDQSKDQGMTRVKLGSGAREGLHRLITNPPAQRREAALNQPRPAPAAAPTPAPEPQKPVGTLLIEVPGNTLEEKLAHLAGQVESDPKPRALGTLRDTMVFAVGSPQATLMFVGEAPGAEEERQREPFVGPAGQLLTKIITNAMGLRREDVYISNICKFRPSMGEGQGSRNRPPTPEEMRACLPYVQTEIALIRPQIIVALGATASTGLGIDGTVGKLRGRFHNLNGTPVMVTYHPSDLLRQDQDGKGMEARRLVWEDMLMVMEKLGMSISEKQRNFFKSKA
jgi:DNA polymerase